MMILPKPFLLITSALVAIVSPQMQTPAEARPFLYMSSFDYSGPYKRCIANAEKVLRSHGFSRDLEIKEFAENKAAVVYAFKDDEALTAEIQCVQKAGITLLGVAGLDNDSTWTIYQKLRTATW